MFHILVLQKCLIVNFVKKKKKTEQKNMYSNLVIFFFVHDWKTALWESNERSQMSKYEGQSFCGDAKHSLSHKEQLWRMQNDLFENNTNFYIPLDGSPLLNYC